MSIGLFIKQKKFIDAELKKGRTDYEKIYQEAKEKQVEEEKDKKLAEDIMRRAGRDGAEQILKIAGYSEKERKSELDSIFEKD